MIPNISRNFIMSHFCLALMFLKARKKICQFFEFLKTGIAKRLFLKQQEAQERVQFIRESHPKLRFGSAVITIFIGGCGMLGSIEYKLCKQLESEGKVRVVGVCDSDPLLLKKFNVPGYTDMRKGLKETNPDIFILCTNTKTHYTMLKAFCEFVKSNPGKKGLFAAKPFVSKKAEAQEIIGLLEKNGQVLTHVDYQFRFSPAFEAAIEFMQDPHNEGLQIIAIQTLWQKMRMEKDKALSLGRPSDGVINDEATHSIDASRHLLNRLNYPTKQVTILQSSYERESEVGIPIVNREKQDELYKDEPERLDPIARTQYTIDMEGVTITGFASFVDGPQRREMTIECSNNTTLLVKFDVAGNDILEINQNGTITNTTYEKPNKLMLSLESFLKYFETMQPFPSLVTMEDVMFDIKITDALESKSNITNVQVN